MQGDQGGGQVAHVQQRARHCDAEDLELGQLTQGHRHSELGWGVHPGLSIQLLPQHNWVQEHQAGQAGELLHGACCKLIEGHCCAGDMADCPALLELQLQLLICGVDIAGQGPGV